MYSGMCVFVCVWICLCICPAEQTCWPPNSYTVAWAHALFTSRVYTCVCWKLHNASLHCITFQSQLNSIQWTYLFPHDSRPWLCITTYSYIILNCSVSSKPWMLWVRVEWLSINSCQKSMRGLHTRFLTQIIFPPTTTYVWQPTDSCRI